MKSVVFQPRSWRPHWWLMLAPFVTMMMLWVPVAMLSLAVFVGQWDPPGGGLGEALAYTAVLPLVVCVPVGITGFVWSGLVLMVFPPARTRWRKAAVLVTTPVVLLLWAAFTYQP